VRVPAAAADTTGAAESDSSAALERFDLEAQRGMRTTCSVLTERESTPPG